MGRGSRAKNARRKVRQNLPATVAKEQRLRLQDGPAMVAAFGGSSHSGKEVPAAGGEGGIRFDIVSDTRQLTRTNPAKRSAAHQRTRGDDAFHDDIGVVGDWNIPWGQEAE